MKRLAWLTVMIGIIVIFIGFFANYSLLGTYLDEGYSQQNASGTKKYDLSTISGRELASIEKPVSPYKVKKCGEVKHTDGAILTVCLAEFDGTTGGFYNSDKELMVLGALNQYTLIHEITHASTLHFYKKGYVNMTSAEVQEKMAYNAENLLSQLLDFQSNLNITPDLNDAKKEKLGIPLN